MISPDAINEGVDPGEALYESPSTRIFRFGGASAAEGVVCKEHLGPHAAPRLRNEIKLLKRLAGIEGVVQMAEGAHGANVLALRDCGATSLAQMLRAGPCDIELAVSLACQLARTLAEVHRAGVIHRDINPSNILVSPAQQAVLIDFDLAVLAEPHLPAGLEGQIVGTLGYLAPEQTGRTGHPVDQRADLYALGATFYEMATGHPPFVQADALQLIHDHLVREPVPPAQADTRVPRGLSDIVMRLLAKAPERRYESLEQRVRARTRELQETQAQLVATARRAGMAEVANNVLHNVGNVLNSINVSASVLRGTIGNSRLDGLARAVELINQHQHDLPAFVATDRGKALWPYLNELVGALRSEQQEALANLDRLSRSVEHVTYVVATQQAHAGPASVLEMVGPHEVVEEAVHLSAAAINRRDIALVRRYEEVPAAALDKQRLVQILVNLIGNAAQAMESVPAPARQLTLGVGLATGEHGRRVRISVQDTGEGIAPENLPRIFAHGFTTRESGHGFGLHSSAVAATEMGGTLGVHSDGPGRGATFTIELPLP
ncbi:protein kinase domain-containing protein [Ramlibacter albus]|uniref:histidine kinase n=1 Tax=Ramlibacter albus TaxID=2079448 RepID=A0A923M3F7_9BURK|nr:ATP-binding protein [Ramlibacter albus]MBC5763203.1 protein kinase [Ramlibacter albus]